jgi:hypothetical protein
MVCNLGKAPPLFPKTIEVLKATFLISSLLILKKYFSRLTPRNPVQPATIIFIVFKFKNYG